MKVDSKVSTLLLDVGSSQLSVEYLASPASPPLMLAGRRFAPDSPVRCHLRGDPLHSLRMLLSHDDVLPPLSSTHIVLGVGKDPLLPALPSLSRTMRLLELLAAKRPYSLLFQTRSPLALLALPVLRRFDRAEIRMAFETLDEKVAQAFFPHLPRPAERLEAARTLRKVGCDVSIQIAPAVFRGNSQSQLEAIVRTLSALPVRAHVVALSRLLPQELPPAAPPEMRALARFVRRLKADAHRELQNELTAGGRHHPEELSSEAA